MTVADLGRSVTAGEVPMGVEAFDGSAIGSLDTEVTMRLHNERALRYILTAPGDLGLVRAYVAGDLELDGTHPGDPYAAIQALWRWKFRRPSASELPGVLRGLKPGWLV